MTRFFRPVLKNSLNKVEYLMPPLSGFGQWFPSYNVMSKACLRIT